MGGMGIMGSIGRNWSILDFRFWILEEDADIIGFVLIVISIIEVGGILLNTERLATDWRIKEA